MKKKLHLSLFAILFAVTSLRSQAQLYINEYSCSNVSQYADTYAKHEDWIEIYNGGSSAVNLTGFYLSDDSTNLTKWKIRQNISIAAGGFSAFWASGRDTGNHTNFKFTQTKPKTEQIVLSDTDGSQIDLVIIIKTQLGHSIGRSTNGGSTWGIFIAPSKGASNNASTQYTAYAETPTISLTAGFYGNAQTVTMSTNNAGLKIRYTTDGTPPTATSALYNNAIKISATTVLKAATFSSSSSVLPSFIVFNTYFINVSHTMKVVSISGYNLQKLADGDNSLFPKGSFEFFDKGKKRKATAYGEFNSHGQDSWANDQRSLDFVARDEAGYGNAIEEKLFPLTDRSSFQKIILRAAGDDNYPAAHHASNDGSAHIRDAFVQNLAKEGGLNLDVRTAEKCIVYLNGKYWGIYDLRENADDHDYTDYNYNQGKYDLQYILTWGTTWAEYGGNKALTDWSTLYNYINSNNMADSTKFAHVDSLLDVKSLADYIIVNSLTVCSDWLNYNTAWWRGLNPNGKHKKWGYALWDNDATFGFYINYTGVPDTSASAAPCNVETGGLSDPEGHIVILQKLRKNKEFDKWYISRYADMLNSTFSTQHMTYVLDSIINLLKPEMTAHAKRWFGTYNEWYKNAQRLRWFIVRHGKSLESTMRSCYNLTGPYDLLLNTNPYGAGKININSLKNVQLPWKARYWGGIDIQLKTTPLDSGNKFINWTSKYHSFTPKADSLYTTFKLTKGDTVTALYKVSSSKVTFSEVNYNNHPKRNSGNWIELYNSSSSSIDVSNFVIRAHDSAKTYTIPQGTTIVANGYLVVVEDTIKFKKIHPSITNFVGPANWGLSNNKDSIVLYDDSGYLVKKMTYKDSYPWPQGADGNGATLELKKYTGDLNDPYSWMTGCPDGSPGEAYTPCAQKVLVNEINYSSSKTKDAGDWFELYNTDTSDFDLSYYIMKDNNDSNYYRFPSNTILKAKEYLVVCNDTVKFKNIFPYVNNYIGQFGFGLSASFDAVRIHNTDSAFYCGVWFNDTIPFPWGAKGTGYTIERIDTMYNITLGASWKLSCINGTPGRARKTICFPKAKFAITEVNMFPDNNMNDGAWIEVMNTDTVDLKWSDWQIKISSNTNNIRLPYPATIKAGERFIICSDKAAFTKWHPTNSATVFGDFNFNKTKDTITINYEGGTKVWSSIVDSNIYNKLAINMGRTMERKSIDSLVNNPSNWFAGCIGGSAGAAYQSCVEPNYISEINYRSAASNDAGSWLELYNNDTQQWDISNWTLRTKLDSPYIQFPANYILAKGQRILLVADSMKFKTAHPYINFDMNGLDLDTLDALKIYDNTGKMIYSMLYENQGLWTDSANGNGYTLELMNDTLKPYDASAWHASCPNGTPGKSYHSNCSPGMQADIYFSEINYKSHTASDAGIWVELKNHSNTALDVSGWAMRNGNGDIYIFAANTVFPANSYIVLISDTNKFFTQNSKPTNYYGLPSNFIQSNSDSLFIYDYSNYLVTSMKFASDKNWPFTPNGLGRTLERQDSASAGNYSSNWFAGCLGGSPGAAYSTCDNSLLISEVNYHSKDSNDAGDWIELYNKSATQIALNGLTIYTRSGNSYILTNAPILLPDSYMVVVGDTQKFNKENWWVDKSIYAPGFNLADSNDVIIVADNNILLQQIYFESDTPWYTMPNGNGYTLELKTSGIDMNTPAAWQTGCPGGSPGTKYEFPCPAHIKPDTNTGIGFGAIGNSLYHIYPSPATTNLIFEYSGIAPQKLPLVLYDMHGKELYRTSILNSVSIDVSKWAAGLYTYRIGEKVQGRVAVGR
ncbi:MAG: lamin tail domain-containing protein [Bacteroidota bacterium]|nr:lamin tail domain-containing protein [Bacteroidota bacterium]